MASITKQTMTNGDPTYIVRYRLDGRALKKSFRRKRDADAFATTMESNKLRGVVIDPRRAKTPVGVVADRWLAAGTTKRVSSAERDEVIVRLHIKPTLGHRAIGAVTKADVQALVDSWSTRVAPSTVGRQYTCLGAIFSYAVADDLILRSPCRGIRLPKVGLVERPFLDGDQLAALSEAMGPDRSAFMWLGMMGLRWAEAAGMTVDRVDLDAGRITVDRQLSREGTFEPTKTSTVRTFDLSPDVADQLTDHVARRRLTDDALLFTDSHGGPLRYSNWRRRIWQPACTAAGLPDLRFHDLRSLAGTYLIASGADVKTTQTRLGHANPTTTLRLYARQAPEADRLAAESVGAMFRPRHLRAIEESKAG